MHFTISQGEKTFIDFFKAVLNNPKKVVLTPFSCRRLLPAHVGKPKTGDVGLQTSGAVCLRLLRIRFNLLYFTTQFSFCVLFVCVEAPYKL